MPLSAPNNWSTEVDKYQNPVSVMNDFSKTVITLASSILAATVAFAGSVLGSHPTIFLMSCLVVSWAALILSIVCGMLVAASLTNYVRGTKPDFRRGTIAGNLSFFLLLLALVSYSVLGGVRLWPAESGISEAIAGVQEVHTFPNVPAGVPLQTAIQSIGRQEPSHNWVAQVTVQWTANGATQAKQFTLTLSGQPIRVTNVQQNP